MTDAVTELLEQCREAEKEQALFYRALAAEAEEEGDALAERFHELHADEQHHLSRLTARLLELGHHPADLAHVSPERVPLVEWEAAARRREQAEIVRYQELLDRALDEDTRALIEETLEVEQHHADELGGKWTLA